MAGCTNRNKKGMTVDRGIENREWGMEDEKILDIRYSILENGDRETTRVLPRWHEGKTEDG